MNVSGTGDPAATMRFWRVAILTAAGAFGTTTHADAALYYWQDYSDGSYYARQPQLQRQRPRKRATARKEVIEKEAGARPQGPLVIAISIQRQKVTIYDSNGLFAEAPVSTGMKGHPTPMGVFSVIQKHKFHHSNIYSGAPMPYMQRITWSGIAMHAGVLPGYPASHGCIRMPTAFAVKMWNWTRMGARVIVAPGEATPSSFSHPLLASMRVPPPAASLEPQADAPPGADKGAPARAEIRTAEIKTAEIKTASSDRALELRATVGHQATTASDATTGNAVTHDDAAAPPEKVTNGAARSAGAASETAAARTGDNAVVRAAETANTEARPADATEARKAPSIAEQKPAEKIEAARPAPDAATDQTRVAEPAPAARAETTRTEATKSKGQIAVFISRKDSRLYVRQNFAPLFDAPVTIATSDRPLGTHVFTVELDRVDANALHWSVVSLPVSIRAAEREAEGHTTRRQRMGAAVIPVAAMPIAAPDSPAEALDRISIAADTMARINEMLSSGSSIIVSDQGINQGETGEGTDFIVRLR